MSELGNEFPVIVAGGGPVGLTTALDLVTRGIRVLVLERNPTTTRHPKMDVTNGRSMELFRRLGVAERIRDKAVPRENCMDVSWVTRMNEWELARFKYPNVHAWRARWCWSRSYGTFSKHHLWLKSASAGRWKVSLKTRRASP
jgi:2-polyprenyl-6-methoxyphenol hydroxylase-like FAD-dependent oxidoreductase